MKQYHEMMMLAEWKIKKSKKFMNPILYFSLINRFSLPFLLSSSSYIFSWNYRFQLCWYLVVVLYNLLFWRKCNKRVFHQDHSTSYHRQSIDEFVIYIEWRLWWCIHGNREYLQNMKLQPLLFVLLGWRLTGCENLDVRENYNVWQLSKSIEFFLSFFSIRIQFLESVVISFNFL